MSDIVCMVLLSCRSSASTVCSVLGMQQFPIFSIWAKLLQCLLSSLPGISSPVARLKHVPLTSKQQEETRKVFVGFDADVAEVVTV